MPRFHARVQELEASMNLLLSEIGGSSINIAQDLLQHRSNTLSGEEGEETEVRSSSSSSNSSSSRRVEKREKREKRERRSKKANDVSLIPNGEKGPTTTGSSTSSASGARSKTKSNTAPSKKGKNATANALKRAASLVEKPKYVGQAMRQSGHKIYYSALVIKGDQYVRPGDSILLQSGEDGGMPYICRVTEIWCDSTKEEAMLRGQWFYRRGDIDPLHLQDPQILSTPYDNHNDEDIFLSNESQPNSAETVLGKIFIIYRDDTIGTIREKKERAKATRMPLYHCNFKYAATAKKGSKGGKGVSHFTKYKSSLMKVREPKLLSYKEEQIAMGSSHRRGNNGTGGSGGKGGQGNYGSHGRQNTTTSSAKRTHYEAELNVPPLLGLERRKSVEFLDPTGGEYTYTINGGSSFKEDGTIIQTKRRKRARSNDAKPHQFESKWW